MSGFTSASIQQTAPLPGPDGLVHFQPVGPATEQDVVSPVITLDTYYHTRMSREANESHTQI